MISRFKPKDVDCDAAREVPMRVTTKFATTKGGKPFLIHDSSISSPHLPRIMIFSSEEQQKLPASSTTVCSDGTFEAVRGILGAAGQCWVLMVPLISGEYVIVGWALMENHQTATYERVITALKGLPTMGPWNPLNISSVLEDFERGARRAWLNQFPLVKINYCVFHYEQNIRKYVMKNKVDLSDLAEFDVYNRVRNLPLLPERDMRDALDDMIGYSPNACKGLLIHLSENYVNGSGNHGPMFEPQEWLLWHRSPSIPRTNNYCEASNSIMNSSIKTIRGICDGASLLEFFQNEEDRVSTGASIVATNPSHRMSLPISKAIVTRNKAIETALSNPKQLTGFSLLDYISCTLAPFQK